MTNQPIQFGPVLVGPGQPVYIIAELACAHEGDVETAAGMVDAAAQAGASAVKFQVFTADGLVVPCHRLHEDYVKFQFTAQQWSRLAGRARAAGLGVLIDVFEPWSLEVADAVNADGLKVHSTNVTNPYFLEKVAAAGRPVIIGTGGTMAEEIRAAIEVLRRGGADDLALMHGFQGYPTAPGDTHLRRLVALVHEFRLPVGFAGHADGGSDDVVLQDLMAIAMGCCLLENHITLDRSEGRTDYHSSLEPKAFEQMIAVVRRMEVALGSGSYELSDAEAAYRATFKSYIVAARDLPAGHTLSVDDVAFKRAESGLLPTELSRMIGRTLGRNVMKDAPLTDEHLAQED